MEKHTLQLPWGNESIALTLPKAWRLSGVLAPSPLPGLLDVKKETERSLASPVGAARLCELVDPTSQIALVIDDDSRPTPVAKILPAIMAELAHGGAQPDQITVVTALGVHRPMTGDEFAQRVGPQVFASLQWENHDPDSMEKLVHLGTTQRGTPVYINKTIAQADVIVSIGCIEPHIIASFGGGYKNLVPGVAGRATIAHNHAINCQPDTFNNVGQPITVNPMRLDLEEAAQMIPAPVFIVNAVLNAALEPVQVVCGDPLEAHRVGVQTSGSIYGVRVLALADVLITTSHPMDQDLRQGVKALANNVRAVRRGGVMITLIRAEEGLGVFGLANRKLPLGRGALKLLAPLILPLVMKLKLRGMGEEDRFFLYFALQAMRHCELLVYAPTIAEEIHERLPFVTFVESPEEALAIAHRRFPAQAEVLVVPHGGSSFPVLSN